MDCVRWGGPYFLSQGGWIAEQSSAMPILSRVFNRLSIPFQVPLPAGPTTLPPSPPSPGVRSLLRRGFMRLAAGLCRQVVLGPQDAQRIIAHYMTLPAPDRRARFHGLITASAINGRYRGLDWSRSDFIAKTFFGRVIALAEICDFADAREPGGEIAVSVLRAWQGLHLGERVMRAAICDICGTRHLPAHAITRHDNVRFIRLARKLGAHGHVADGEYDAVFNPA